MTAIMTDELWKPVMDYEEYYDVSSLGRVRVKKRESLVMRYGKPYQRSLPPKLMKTFIGSRGYKIVQLSRGGEKKTFDVHTLVLRAFIGERPEGFECCHYDGDRGNPKLENLRWGSKSDNYKDKIRHNRIPNYKGSVNPNAKLTEFDIYLIRDRLEKGEPQKSIAKLFDIQQAAVSRIKRRESWAHLP